MKISEESGTVLKYLEERDRFARFARYARSLRSAHRGYRYADPGEQARRLGNVLSRFG